MTDRTRRKMLGETTDDASTVGETSGVDLTSETTEVTRQYDSPQAQLKVLNDAIYAILAGGQSYKIGSRSLTRADLGTLISERDKIEQKLDDSEASPLFSGTFASYFGYDNRR